MRTLTRILLASGGAALAGLAPRGAAAQADLSPHLPNVLLLLDTSGSMEYLIPPDPNDPSGVALMTPESPHAPAGAQCIVPANATNSPAWSSTNATTVENRWASLVSVLTGSFASGAFGCEDAKRNTGKFVSEYSYAGTGNPYDYNYFLDWHRIYSNGCTVGVPNATPLLPTQDWTKWASPTFDFHTSAGTCASSAANCCSWTGQNNDGVLDVFSGMARFGLMTFDSYTDPSTGAVPGASPPSINAAGANAGMWSYFHGWQSWNGGTPTVGVKPAAGNPSGCSTPQFFEVGARNPAAPPWEGPLTPFGDALSDANVVQNNTNIQWEILAMRPYGATPIAGMLDDAQEFLYLDHNPAPGVTPTRDFGPWEDPYWVNGCRKTYIILLTDGEPNLDLRGATGMCDQPPPGAPNTNNAAGNCPYLLPETTLTNMRLTPPTGNINQSVTTFVVGFAVSNPAQLPSGEASCSQINPATDCINPAPSIQDCCELQKLAVAGGGVGSTAYFADNPAQLKIALSSILSQIVGSATARTSPVYSPAPPYGAQGPTMSSSTTGASSYVFGASFNVSSSPTTGTLATGGASGIWTGNLVRERYVCGGASGGGLTPTVQSVSQLAGDDYAYNIDYPDRPRELFTAIGATVTNGVSAVPTINSDWTMRPYITGVDGFGTYGPDTATPTTLMTDAAFPTLMQAYPNAFGIQQPTDPLCAGAFGFGSPASQCVTALMTWEVGGTNALAPPFVPAVSRDPASAYCQAKNCPALNPNNPETYGCQCHKLGAIYHSTPAVMGPPNESLRDDSYVAYANLPAVVGQPVMLYTASTDGQLHGFKVSATVNTDPFTTDKAHNNELWSFLPPAVLKHILPNFNSGGSNLLDGAPVVVDVPGALVSAGAPPLFQRTATSPVQWHRVLVASGGAGGGFYYALDITDPTQAPQFLWQLSTDGVGNPIFGVTTPTPAVAIVALNIAGATTQVPVAILSGGSGALAASSCAVPPPHPPTTGIATKNPNNPSNPSGAALPLDVHNLPPLRCWAGNTVYDVGTNHAVGNNNGAASTGNAITIVRLDTGAVLAHFTGAGYWGASGIGGLQGDDGHHDTGGPNGNVFSTQPFTAPMTGAPIVYPSNVGAIADHAYVGDADGQLWRIDLSGQSTAQWSVALAWDAYIDSSTAKREVIELPPVLSRDAFGNVVVALATGNQTLLTTQATDRRVWSLTETPSQVAGQKWSVSQNWYIPFPAGTQHVTGPMEVFNGGLYFATYSPQPTGSNVCAPNSAAVWGVDYVRPQLTPAGSACTNNLSPQGLPIPLFVPTPGAPPVFCQATATPDNTVIFGVSAAETPSCDVSGGSLNDPYFGAHNYVSGVSQSTYQLKWQTGMGAGLAQGGNVQAEAKGSSANPIQHMQSMTLPAPGQQTRIDSWAALVE